MWKTRRNCQAGQEPRGRRDDAAPSETMVDVGDFRIGTIEWGVLHIRGMGLFRSNREEYGEELLYFQLYIFFCVCRGTATIQLQYAGWVCSFT